MYKFKKGDWVVMTREPTDYEWRPYGKMTISPEVLAVSQQISEVNDEHENIGISFVGDRYSFIYPACCFELVEDVQHRIDAEKYKKDTQKHSLLEYAKQNYPPGTTFKNSYGSNSHISDDPQYKYDDGYLYAKCVTDKHVRIYDKLSGWATIVSRPSINNIQAKEGDYIKIIDGCNVSYLEGQTFFVDSLCAHTNGVVTFQLEKLVLEGGNRVMWSCSSPNCYEIVSVKKEYSDIQMSNYEPPKEFKVGDRVKVIKGDAFFTQGLVSTIREVSPSSVRMNDGRGSSYWIGYSQIEHTDEYPRVEAPIKYNVGDTVVGLPSASKRYAITNEGWEGVITHINKHGTHFDACSVNNNEEYSSLDGQHFTLKTSKSEGPRYKVDLPTFDHGSLTKRLSELQTEYFKQIKNPENGTENQQSVKLQGVNLKIRERSISRGIGLKSSRSKIKLGSDDRYH